MGFLEAAAMLGDGAGKGALFVAEKLRFQKVPGDRAAVHGAVILGRPLALGMDGARHHFLAAAGRAGDDHRSRAGRDLADQTAQRDAETGRAAVREREGKYGLIYGGAVS